MNVTVGKKLAVTGVLMTLGAQVHAVGAAGTLVYSPAGETAAIPTLSEWTLALLAVGLAALAYRKLRIKTGGKPLASLLVAGALAWGALAGGPLVERAYAAALFHFGLPAGGTLTVTLQGEMEIDNTSGKAQRITSVAADAGLQIYAPVGAPQCTVGLVVPVGGSCYVNFDL